MAIPILGASKVPPGAIAITEEKIVVCECGNDTYMTTVRLAKVVKDLVHEGIGLTNETPGLICAKCFKGLPMNFKSIKTKGDLAAIKVEESVVL